MRELAILEYCTADMAPARAQGSECICFMNFLHRMNSQVSVNLLQLSGKRAAGAAPARASCSETSFPNEFSPPRWFAGVL